MKKSIILFCLFFLNIGIAYCQFARKNPITTLREIPVVSQQSTNDIKMPDRNSLKILESKYYSFKGKRKIDTGSKIHWYALEKENDSVYWKNVNCDKVIIEFKKGTSIKSKEVIDFLIKTNLNQVLEKSMYSEIQNFYVLKVTNGNRDRILNIVKEAKKLQSILYAEPEVRIKQHACIPNDANYNQQWGPYVMRVDTVWCFTNRASNNWIGVIDVACDWNHEDLYNSVWGGYDFAMNDNSPTPDYSGQDHGTHVSGIIGATRNNGIGIAGVSMDTIYFAKVQDNDPNNPYMSTTAILNALNTIANYSNVKIINMSLGSPSPSQAEETAINNVFNNNKLIIASSGNDNSSLPSYPGAYTNVISVAAVGVDNSYNLVSASYSNYGSTIDISAPGGESSTGFPIYSTLPNNTYGGPNWQGTSMAAPHVTGVAAIIWAANPFLTNTQVRTILEQQVYDLGTTGWDPYFGSGMCNAWAAFSTACSQLSISITPSASTTFCAGNSITLNAPSNPNVIYQWRKNGVNISGATTNSYIVTTAGSYSLYIQTLGGCQATSNTIVVNVTNVPSTPTSITGLTNVCTNQNNVSYSISPISNATSYLWSLPNGASGNSNTNSIIVSYSSIASSGNISVKGVNSCGSGGVVNLPINVSASPIIPSILWNGSQFSTTATGVAYQWFLNGNSISGATSSTYTPISIGTYKLQITAGGCTSVSDNFNLIVTGIDPTLTLSPYTAQVFPNPASNDFAIKFWETPETTVELQLVNNLGAVVKSVKTKSQLTTMKVSNLSSGVYYLKIIGGNYNQTKKVQIIKQK